VLSRILLKIFLVCAALFLLFEAVAWIFIRFPVEPVKELRLSNDIPGFKKDTVFTYDRHQFRTIDWTPGEKPAGAVRILIVGGWATWGLLQNNPDTWWGQLHKGLKDAGLDVQTAARGFERTGILHMAASLDGIMDQYQPDIILLNTGFDDAIVHPLNYTYDKDRYTKLPGHTRDSTFKRTALAVSQFARFWRGRNASSEANKVQNTWGRTNYFKTFFVKKAEDISRIPFAGSIEREEGHDPLPEYFDGLAAFAAIAARNKAALVITGEAALQDSDVRPELGSRLLAYVPMEAPNAQGEVRVTRPGPGWVWREMRRLNATAEEFAARNKLTYFNLNDRVPRTAENFQTDVLLTDAGAAAAAKILLPILTPIVKEKTGK
jgi:hypothetical protein